VAEEQKSRELDVKEGILIKLELILDSITLTWYNTKSAKKVEIN